MYMVHDEPLSLLTVKLPLTAVVLVVFQTVARLLGYKDV